MRRFGVCLSLALLLGACGSGGDSSSPGSTTTTPGADTTTTSPAVPPAGLRGVRVRAFACTPRPISAASSPEPVAVPDAFLLCPLGVPEQPDRAVTVAAGRPSFAALVAALSAADEPPGKGVCPAYADALQIVLARTHAGVYLVTIPTDSCRHYQHGALVALGRARGS